MATTNQPNARMRRKSTHTSIQNPKVENKSTQNERDTKAKTNGKKGISMAHFGFREEKKLHTQIFIHWGVQMQSSLNSFQ